MNFIKKNIPAFIIILFHVIGLIGFIINPTLFKNLSHVNLLLTVGLVLLTSNQSHIKFYITFIAIACIGFMVEVIGVKTGVIFGTYQYGNAFGYKLFSVPLLIGVNWALLIYCTSAFYKSKNTLVNALISAILMVVLDFFMEQQCSRFDFWYWKNSIIPLQNFVAWFLISFVINLFLQKHINQKPTYTAKVAYITQLVFFVILYFVKS